MEPRDEKQTGGLFIAGDIIRTAKESQSHIAGLSPEAQPQMVVKVIGMLGDPNGLYSGNKVFFHALETVLVA